MKITVKNVPINNIKNSLVLFEQIIFTQKLICFNGHL